MLDIFAITSFTSVKTDLLPLVFAALFLDAAIIGIWYMIGSLFANATIKASARNELYQLLGTGVMIFVIIFVLLFFSTSFYYVLSANSLSSPTTISSMCNNLEQNSNLQLLNPNAVVTSGSINPNSSITGSVGYASILESQSKAFPGLCSMVGSSSGLTQQIDYPLSASGVVLANLTNQTALQLNNLFVLDAFVGFLYKLKPEVSFCLMPGDIVPICILIPAAAEVSYSYAPFAGLEMIWRAMGVLAALMIAAFESFTAQLTILTIALYSWPYLLFGGMVLRVTPFTRRIGGFLIAVAIGMVVFYPLVFMTEYMSLGGGLGPAFGQNGVSSIYGYNSMLTNNVTYIPGKVIHNPDGTTQIDPYIPNFYVLPNIYSIGTTYGCDPTVTSTNPSLFDYEAADLGYLMIPFAGIYESYLDANSNTPPPVIHLPYGCTRTEALQTLFTIFNVYGIIAVTAYFLPIINILIVLSGIIGLSGLLGGETQIIGLSRLV